MVFNFKNTLGFLCFLFLILTPAEAKSVDKLLFNGTSSGDMYLSAPPVAGGTVVLPSLPGGGTSYLLDGTRRVITKPPLKGGGALSGDLSLSLDLNANYGWRGTQNYSRATSIMPNSYGLPSTCLAGSIYVNLSSPTSKQLYLCEASGTWVAVGGGGGEVSIGNSTLLTGSSILKLSGTQTVYIGSSVSTNLSEANMAIAAKLTVRTIRVEVSTAPQTNAFYTLFLYKNTDETSHTGVVAAGTTSVTINLSEVFDVGDTLALKVVPSAGPNPAPAYISFSAQADFS
jgi:hypothetical protein